LVIEGFVSRFKDFRCKGRIDYTDPSKRRSSWETLLKVRRKIKKDGVIKEQFRPNQQRKGIYHCLWIRSKIEASNCSILVFRNFLRSVPLLIIWSNSTIGPIRIMGKFLMNRGEIDPLSLTDDSSWVQF
jgi:hypothetical protein